MEPTRPSRMPITFMALYLTSAERVLGRAIVRCHAHPPGRRLQTAAPEPSLKAAEA